MDSGETTSIVTLLTAKEHIDALQNNPERLSSWAEDPYLIRKYSLLMKMGKAAAPGQIGEIIVKGPDIMQGYWKEPALTGEAIIAGCMRTGDMARVDEEGYIYIVNTSSLIPK